MVNMSAEARREFLLSWSIKNFFNVSSEPIRIKIPVFRVEVLENSEWILTLYSPDYNNFYCKLQRCGCSETSEGISVYFQYELTNSSGVILKSSDILNHTFPTGGFTNYYKLIEFRDLERRQDVHFLRCRISPHVMISTTPISCSVVGFEAETDIVRCVNTFRWSLKFSAFETWSAVKRITASNLPIEITFKYVRDEILIELFSETENKTLHYVQCEIFLLTQDNNQLNSVRSNFEFSDASKVWKFPSFISKQNLKIAKCFSHKQININLTLWYQYNSKILNISNCKNNSSSAKDTALIQNKHQGDCVFHLQQHFKNMFNDKIYADVKLCADGENIFAHKCLLAARSPVFRAMFDQDMLESKMGMIDINDVEAKTLKLFLEYLYTGAVDDMNDEIALSLLVVADKYEVSPLTEKCSTFLKSVLSFDNVLNVLSVADMVNQEQLKLFAIEYVVEYSTVVLASPDWPQWMKMNYALTFEVFLKLSKKFDSTSKSSEE